MSGMLRWAVIGALAVMTLIGAKPAALAAAPQRPRDLLAEIYAAYAGKGRGVDITSPAAMKRYLTPEFANLIRKKLPADRAKGDAPSLDWDPFIGGQDWKLTKLTIEVAQAGPNAATGTVSFDNLGEAKRIILDLKLTKAGWRIDDIRGSEGSLRKLLSAGR